MLFSLAFLVVAAAACDDPEPINLGTGAETTIRDLAETIRRLVGFEGRIAWDPTKPDGQPRRSLDTRRAAERLGWRASTHLGEGLRHTIGWFHANRVYRTP